jgi:hypothetical protein
MGVSDLHVNLVQELANWVNLNCQASERALMLLDLPETRQGSNPPIIGGFIPDLYIKSNRLVIGEAKTAGDLDRQHTRDQLTEYIKYLNQRQDSLLLIAVPWYCVPRAKSMVRNIVAKLDANKVSTVFLEKLPG